MHLCVVSSSPLLSCPLLPCPALSLVVAPSVLDWTDGQIRGEERRGERTHTHTCTRLYWTGLYTCIAYMDLECGSEHTCPSVTVRKPSATAAATLTGCPTDILPLICHYRRLNEIGHLFNTCSSLSRQLTSGTGLLCCRYTDYSHHWYTGTGTSCSNCKHGTSDVTHLYLVPLSRVMSNMCSVTVRAPQPWPWAVPCAPLVMWLTAFKNLRSLRLTLWQQQHQQEINAEVGCRQAWAHISLYCHTH